MISGFSKTDEELAPKRHGFHVRRVVFAIAGKPGLKLRSRQTLDFRLQSGQQATSWFPPDLVRRRLAGLGGRRRDGRRRNDRGRRDKSLVVDFEECHRIRSSRVPAPAAEASARRYRLAANRDRNRARRPPFRLAGGGKPQVKAPPLAIERRSERWSEFPDFVDDYEIVVQVAGRVAVFGGGVSVFLRLGGLTRL